MDMPFQDGELLCVSFWLRRVCASSWLAVPLLMPLLQWSIRRKLATLGVVTSGSSSGTDFDRPFWSRDLGGMQSTDRTKLYYVGIIDILTHWNARKKVEHVARVLQSAPSPAHVPTPYT